MNSKKENLWSKVSTFLVFAGPATFSFLAVVIVPFLYGVYLTFTSWDGVSSNKPFVGLKNYAAVVADSSFWQSLGLTLLYVVVSVILVNVIGFLLALLVTGKIKGKNFFRAGFFTPNLIGGIILGYIWQFVFNKVIVYFGDAHGIVGRLVLYCLDKKIPLDEMTLEEYKAISPVFEEDIYEAISIKTCVEKRMTIGAPGPDAMAKVVEWNKKYLEEK